MDSRERVEHYDESVASTHDGDRAQMWTAVPCIVQSADFDKQTCVLQPAIKGVVRKPDGTEEHVALPLLQDVPMYYPTGGGVTLTFPVAKGDECLAVLSCRSIDNWFQQGGVQQQIDARMHDLSDAFALVGFRSQPRKLKNVSPSSTQLRSDDGQHYIDLHPQNGITIKSPKDMTIDVPNLRVTGDVIADSKSTAISLLQHKHGQVMPGGGVSGKPVAS